MELPILEKVLSFPFQFYFVDRSSPALHTLEPIYFPLPPPNEHMAPILLSSLSILLLAGCATDKSHHDRPQYGLRLRCRGRQLSAGCPCLY